MSHPHTHPSLSSSSGTSPQGSQGYYSTDTNEGPRVDQSQGQPNPYYNASSPQPTSSYQASMYGASTSSSTASMSQPTTTYVTEAPSVDEIVSLHGIVNEYIDGYHVNKRIRSERYGTIPTSTGANDDIIASGSSVASAKPTMSPATLVASSSPQPPLKLKVYKCKRCKHVFASAAAREEHLGPMFECRAPPITATLRRKTFEKNFPRSMYIDSEEDDDDAVDLNTAAGDDADALYANYIGAKRSREGAMLPPTGSADTTASPIPTTVLPSVIPAEYVSASSTSLSRAWTATINSSRSEHPGTATVAAERPTEAEEKADEVTSQLGSSPQPSPGSVCLTSDQTWVCNANSCITFRMVNTESDLSSLRSSFSPAFTHQIFNDEEIVGYKGLSLDIYFTAGSLYPYFSMKYRDVRGAVTNSRPAVDPGRDIDPSALNPLRVDDPITMLASKFPKECICEDMNQLKERMAEAWIPPGTLIHSYEVPSVTHQHKGHKLDYTYHVFKASLTDPEMRSFHERLQFFLLFFIDRSSFIDSTDPVWEVLLVCEKATNRSSQETTWRVVGYTTLYSFINYPKGMKLRLSQILILPSYQRMGHGHQLLTCIFDEAERRKVVEVNVEDPAKGFQALRDVHDVSRCREHGFFQRQGRNTFVLAGSSSTLPSHTDQYPLPNGSLSIPSAPTYSSASSAATPPLISASLPPAAGNIVSTVDGYREPLTTVSVSDAEVKASKIEQLGQRPPMIWDPEYATMVKNTLRTTMAQVRRCYEIFKLAYMDPRADTELTNYRLEIKRRLFKDNEEELSVYVADPEGRKARLQEMYNELVDSYREIIRKARIR